VTRVPPPAPATAKAPAASATKTPPPAGSWFVQVGSFKSKDNAEALVAKLKTLGFDADFVDVPKPLLHVRVGPYAERSAAEAARDKLKKDGYPSSIISR
jgi:DedD protein